MKRRDEKTVRGDRIIKMCCDTHARPIDWSRVRVLQGTKIQPMLDWVVRKGPNER